MPRVSVLDGTCKSRPLATSHHRSSVSSERLPLRHAGTRVGRCSASEGTRCSQDIPHQCAERVLSYTFHYFDQHQCVTNDEFQGLQP